MTIYCRECSAAFDTYSQFQDHDCPDDGDQRVPLTDGGTKPHPPTRLGENRLGPNKGCYNLDSTLVHAGAVDEHTYLGLSTDAQYDVIDLSLEWDQHHPDLEFYLSIDLTAAEARTLATLLERSADYLEEVGDDGE